MDIMKLPKRKSTRIAGYDYSTPGSYFITICCHEKKCFFREKGYLSDWGLLAEQGFGMIPKIYPTVHVDKFVIMPNHVHAILTIDHNSTENQQTLTKIVGQYKMTVTKNIRKISPDAVIWQRSFYDHAIRNQADYERIWTYIHGNPQKWSEDCYYTDEEF
jgi:REP element-mobilizing transposase RayT